jgi:glucosamine--fructose-6-phosphate aminotransferase (isomerizing)
VKAATGSATLVGPTHGRPTEENAHPHRDCRGEVVVVHNGIVENYLSLKKSLIAEGHTFVTETDTEVIAHLVEKHLTGSLEEAVRKTLAQITGIYAVVVLSTKDPHKIVAARIGPTDCLSGSVKANLCSL